MFDIIVSCMLLIALLTLYGGMKRYENIRYRKILHTPGGEAITASAWIFLFTLLIMITKIVIERI